MSKVTVHKIGLYNPATDSPILSRRMATCEGAKLMRGWIIENTAVEIDASQLEPGKQWTAIDFNPNPRTGFQTQVER